MKTDIIKVHTSGYVHCKSAFYSAQDSISENKEYTFYPGVNKLVGDIDSGNWAISYLLSMYNCRNKDFILFDQPRVEINKAEIKISELSEFSCYMDKSYRLFSSAKTIRQIVSQNKKSNNIELSTDDIMSLFRISDDRFDRSLKEVGNEIFKAMAAIAYCNKKEIFCFPWMSYKRYESYHQNLSGLLEILEGLNKLVILPIGNDRS